MKPDLAGFRAAQQRKRDELGEDVLFLHEPSITFPPGTPTDPETGRPYDPVLTPTASARASAIVRCAVAVDWGTREDVEDTPAGIFARGDVMAIAPSGAASAIDGAIELEVRGVRYSVRSQTFDGVAGIDRFLTIGEKQ